VTIASKDFERLGERAQALIREMGAERFAAATGLSLSTVRRLLNDPAAVMRARGATAVIVIVALQISEGRS